VNRLVAQKIALLFFLILLCVGARAQLMGTGWTPLGVNFKIQSPTNAPQSSRYWLTNELALFGVTNVLYHCLTYSNDGAFSVGNTTLPRTEQRFNPDYTNGEIHYQAKFWCPSNENSYSIFQIHTGDAQSAQFGSTTFMAFWFTNNNGSVHDYSGTTLATNLGNRWFQLNFDHNLVTRTIRLWIDQKLVWTQQDNGAGDFYIKDGVYEQSHGPTLQMDTYIITNSIKEWVSSGTNPPAPPDGLTATPSNALVMLSWNAGVTATNYYLKRALTNDGPYTVIATVTGTNFIDATAVAGRTNFYVVSALDQFGESSNSPPASASLVGLGAALKFSKMGLNRTNFIFNGTGGVPGRHYVLLVSTNLGSPADQWPRVLTNAFDSAGNFNFTNGAATNSKGEFFRLQLP